MSRLRRDNVSAIFVHAGAGFHHPDTQSLHLETCENAAKVAMTMLKNGGSAVDAVEMAIMLMEDTDITNAGYGSNMTIDGTVECDATIVNHLGRSGAVGAVAQVKNPISLARVVLENTTKPLLLERVPPNFLVGQGATDFAYEHGLVVLPHDGLKSSGAMRRWNDWHKDLEAAHLHQVQQSPAKYQAEHHKACIRRPVNVHPAQLLAPAGTIPPPSANSHLSGKSVDLVATADEPRLVSRSSGAATPANSNRHLRSSPAAKASEYIDGALPHECSFGSASGGTLLGASTILLSESNVSGIESGSKPQSGSTNTIQRGNNVYHTQMDRISDTVGAIAVDSQGNIAAGSSSGGIGMKHRGRIGPAALVGVGTTVIPVDPSDPEKTCVATVTSGTGEHITTTMAASTCASRIYYNQRKCSDGSFEEVAEDEALRSTIASDFMGHPGVKGSHHPGAIGVMAVKKTVDGVYLWFSHNTDSFALASMSSEDKRPVSVMSRNNGHGTIAQGGRAYRYKRYRISGAPA
ncbi:nucleophile aminohydrolase [Aspergillus avenaceus]|uniref:Nucleophile aminohydrolase n=1 Tax=Aspergillus avenaceus TaxID=36643 RepID=A0A5N6TSM4_ASPAV|nr:nucleophile aminohydrolase [Aspergillus avenaceus]